MITKDIDTAVKILKNGGVIIYPTDTFYGIGCDIMNKKAIEKVYQIKQRDKKQPFSFICPNLKDISKYAKVSNVAYRNMKRLLPGPYTFILLGSKMVPKIMLTKRKTIGIRVPDNKICLAIVRALGCPIISTSAGFDNPHDIEKNYGPHLDLVIDGGVLYPDPSTVISLMDDVPEIIRKGKGDVSYFL